MLIRLTHPEPNYEFWIETDEITVMERYTKPTTTLITLQDEKPDVTAIVLKSGKIMAAKETPSEIMAIVKGRPQ